MPVMVVVVPGSLPGIVMGCRSRWTYCTRFLAVTSVEIASTLGVKTSLSCDENKLESINERSQVQTCTQQETHRGSRPEQFPEVRRSRRHTGPASAPCSCVERVGTSPDSTRRSIERRKACGQTERPERSKHQFGPRQHFT